METFDISTREGFLRDFDLLEKAVLKARNQIGADAADEILKGTLKNSGSQNQKRETAVESELGRIPVCLMDDMAQSLQPKERVCSTGYMELSCRLCTRLSYRNATEMINLFQHRDADGTIKLRTLSDSVERVGEQISARLEEMTQKVLKMYGFDSETGCPMEGVCLSANITSPAIPEKTEADIQAVDIIIDSANASRDEKIPFTAQELDMEASPLECVYVSIDDVGVRHQKDSRYVMISLQQGRMRNRERRSRICGQYTR